MIFFVTENKKYSYVWTKKNCCFFTFFTSRELWCCILFV